MLTQLEKVVWASDFDVLSAVFQARAKFESVNHDELDQQMISDGYQPVVASPDQMLYDDGREILRAHGKAWVLRLDIHERRRLDALDEAMQQQAAAHHSTPRDKHHDEPAVSEGIATVTCPQMSGGRPCGGALNRSQVCPSCVTGKMGYKYRYTCESCGCDIVTREELK